MAQLTIKGQIFEVADDPSIAPGTPLTEGMAASLQQTRRENIRNNMAKKVEEALNGSEELPRDRFDDLQALVNEYADKYEFGIRQAGAPRVTDPVEKEARRDVAEAIKAAYFRRHGDKLKGESLNEAVEQVMAAKGDTYRERARARIREREAAGEDVLAATGLSGAGVGASA
jgi:hypothetical protein